MVLPVVFGAVGLLVAVLAVVSYGGCCSYDVLLERRDDLAAAVAARPWQTAALFVLFYALSVSLFLPTAALLAMTAGAMFGVVLGVPVVLAALGLGALLGLLLSRYLLSEFLRQRWPETFNRIDAGVATEGPFYLFALRVVPLVPFCVINLGMGLTRMPLPQYLAVTLVGLLPSALVLVNAGAQLAEASRSPQPLTPSLILALSLLGVFPLAARFGIRWFRRWLGR